MKYLLLFISILVVQTVQSKSYLTNTYIVVSDKPSKDVAKGTCRVFGTIHNNEAILQNALVSNIDRSRSGVSNEKGEYSFLLSENDSSIFFFKEGFNEQVIWSYDFKSGHEVQIDFYAGKSANNIMIETVDKPVIYLYSEKEIEVDLAPNFKGELLFTYPAIESEWQLKVESNKIEDVKTEKNYPYLFWEGELENVDFYRKDGVISGAVVHKDKMIPYLESSLTEIGLNASEKTDFITFWGPRLLKSNYALIQFLVDDQVDGLLGKLNVSPVPESSKRVYLLFKSFDSEPSIKLKEQNFNAFERSGFTLLEWGGTHIHHSKIDF